MTANQIAYQKLREEQRANLENERREREESEAKKDQLLALLEQNLAQARKINAEAEVAELESAIEQIKAGDFQNQWLESVLQYVERGSKVFKDIMQGIGSVSKLIG